MTVLFVVVTVPLLAVLGPRTEWGAVSISASLSVLYLAVCSSLVGYAPPSAGPSKNPLT